MPKVQSMVHTKSQEAAPRRIIERVLYTASPYSDNWYEHDPRTRRVKAHDPNTFKKRKKPSLLADLWLAVMEAQR